MREINDAGLSLIKEFEGCSLTPYLDSAGIPTQGYGHVEGVTMNSPAITQEEADNDLSDDLEAVYADIERLVTQTLGDNQYSALCSLVFNLGSAPLLDHLGEYLNAGDFGSTISEWSLWVHAKVNGDEIVIPGLQNRRAAEIKLFNTPDGE